MVDEIIEVKSVKLENIGMKLDELKTETCIFRRKQKDQKKEAPGSTKKKIIYLGMRINKKLDWKDHIEFRIQMGEIRLAKVKNLCKKKWLRQKYARIVI